MAEDIAHWLDGLGLGEYAAVFVENDIDLEILPHLLDEDLAGLGLSLGHMRKLQVAVKALSVDEPPALPTSPLSQELEPQPVEAERRQVSVLFCDLVGSTALSGRLDPEDMRDVMRHYQDAVARAVVQCDGHVANYLGDGIVVYFGWPRAREDQAERAVRGGLAALAALATEPMQDGELLQARIGIATGAVVVGDLSGEASHQTDAVSGQAPNLAARLQALAEPGQIVIDGATRQLLGARFELEDIGTHTLKGLDGSVPGWRVRGEAIVESRFDATHFGHLTKLIGREEELALLLSRWSRAAAGDGQVVLLSGEAGIGKSRIVRGLREHLGSAPHTPLRYQCSPHFTNSALYPVISQLERAAGFARDDPLDERFAKLEGVLAETERSKEQTAALLSALLSLPIDKRYPPLNMSPQKRLEDTLEALLEQAAAFAAHAPALMIAEDLHWADPTMVDLLGRLIAMAADHPILLLLTFRPNFDPPWPGHAHVTALTLSRLGRAEGTAVIEHMTGGKPLPEVVHQQIVDKTDGVPLFLEELTKTVLESGLIEDVGDQYELTGHLPNLAIPSTLQDSLMARLDRLSPVKEVAQIGACIGREFSYSLLADVSPLSGNELPNALQQLVAAELIFRQGTSSDASYQFKHALVRDAAYESLLKSRRQQLHSQIATAIEKREPKIRETNPELLALHHQLAGHAESAAELWLDAGIIAMTKSNNSVAAKHLQNGIEICRSIEQEKNRLLREIDLLTVYAAAHYALSGWGSEYVRNIQDRALENCNQIGEEEKKIIIYHGIGSNCWLRNEIDNGIFYYNKVLEIALDIESEVDILLGEALTGALNVQKGNLEFAKNQLEAVIGRYDPKKYSNLLHRTGLEQGVFSHLWYGLAQLLEGDWVGAQQSIKEAEILSLETGHFFSQTMVYFVASWIALLCEDYERAKNWSAQGLEIGTEQSLPMWGAFSDTSYGYAIGKLDSVTEGVASIRGGIEKREFMGTRSQIGQIGLWLGTLLLDSAELDDAISLVNDLDEIVQSSGDVTELANWLHFSAKISKFQDRPSDAMELLEQMISVASESELVWFELRAIRDLAPLMVERGQVAEAIRRMDDIFRRLIAPGDAPIYIEAQEIRRSLDTQA